MSNCELIRGLPSHRFSGLDSLENLGPNRELLQSDSMRDNWETAEPLGLTASQHHPSHSPTTPSWGIADRTVKEEVMDYSNCESPEYGKSIMEQRTPEDSLNGLDDNSITSPTMSGDKSELESEELDDAGVPRVNSQGKVKTFRCRQCNYIAITKLEFWQHNRSHIKAEKLLTCPKCPFVTEYKHHLEYHLRNHFGSKPFKCDKCSYSCVNKSMLNSHLKSHSNIYQYRCANCAYATKYCHSLKLHLRKYNHEPAMVLNADGSPNPLPIIDVYGTRRGPKQKPMKMQEDGQYDMQGQLNNNMMNALQSSFLSSQMMVQGQMSQIGSHMNMAVMNNRTNGLNGMNGFVPNAANVMAALSYNPMFSGFPLTSTLLLGEDNSEKTLKIQALLEYAKSINNEKIQQDLPKNNLSMGNFAQNTLMNTSANGIPVIPVINERLPSPEDENEDGKVAPLDLSKPDSNPEKEKVILNCPKMTGTSRRKGKAVKLDKRVMEEESDDEQEHEQEQGPILDEPATTSDLSIESVTENKDSVTNGNIGMISEFTCQYCEISFGNDVMYTVHMGYHGYQNPYICNMCGHQSSDKVSFFLHIAKSKH